VRRASLIGLCALGAGCTYVNDPTPVGSQPQPLRLLASTPPAGATGVPLGSAVTLTWSGFPDPSSLGRFGVVTLRSGVNSFDFTLSVDLVGRALVLQPRSPLTAGAGYDVEVSSALRGLDGAAAMPARVSFTAGQAPGGGPPSTPRRTLAADVQPLLDAGCALASCHDAQGAASGLALDAAHALAALVGVQAAEAPGQTRVVAGNPASSYLLRKLLATPDIHGLPMPSGGVWPDASIRIVSDWSVGGAAD
jgi:hypothetical protein